MYSILRRFIIKHKNVPAFFSIFFREIFICYACFLITARIVNHEKQGSVSPRLQPVPPIGANIY